MHIDEGCGIKFDMNGDEFRNHCRMRAEYHEGRRKFYEEEEKRFTHEEDELAKQGANKYSNTTTVSNRQRMADSKLHHQDRFKFFTFATKHLLGDHYKMTQGELINFEFIPR